MLELTKDVPCPHCGRFDNRGISVDAVIIKDSQVLLIRRGVEPYKGYWGTPGGYVLWDHTIDEEMMREVKEETGLQVTKFRLLTVNSDPKRHPRQVVNFVYLVEVEDKQPVASDDAADIKWFPLDSLPDKLAFDHHANIELALSAAANN